MLATGFRPPNLQRPSEVMINPWSFQALGPQLVGIVGGNLANGAWPAANLGIFVPFWVPEPYTVTKVWWGNGAVAGSVDVGVYDEGGNCLVSAGSTAVAGANTMQAADVTDTTIARGTYYMAIVASTVTTLTMQRIAPAAGILQSLGVLEQAGITMPLSTGANPATFAVYTRAYLPYFGIQGHRAVGPV